MNLLTRSPYLMTMKLKVKEEKWFEADFAMSFVVAFVDAVIYYLLFHYVFEDSTVVNPTDITIYYIIINIVALAMTPAQFTSWIHMTDINTGKIIPFLMRPSSYVVTRYLESVCTFFMRTVVNIILIYLVSLVLGKPIILLNLLLGVGSMLAGFTILYLIQAIIGCMAVWFQEVNKIRNVFMTFLMMLGGRLIPSDLLFSGLKEIVYYTPIPYVYDIPVKVLTDKFQYTEIGIQLMWIVLLGAIYIFEFEKYVKHNIELGG